VRTSLFLALCLAFAFPSFVHADEILDHLVKRVESAPEREKANLYAEIAEHQLQEADHLYSAGRNEEARADVQDIVTYSEKASEASDHSTMRLKRTEISLRKMAAKLRDIRRTVAFEEQQPLEDAATRLETLRTDLLARMFSKGEK
jgi:hypothetical protein